MRKVQFQAKGDTHCRATTDRKTFPSTKAFQLDAYCSLQWQPLDVSTGAGPQVNKFKQVSCNDHQMSVAGVWSQANTFEQVVRFDMQGVGYPGDTLPCDLTHDIGDVHLPMEKLTDICENITFLQLRLRKVINSSTNGLIGQHFKS